MFGALLVVAVMASIGGNLPGAAVAAPSLVGCGSSLQARIDSSSAGSVLDLTGCAYSRSATIAKALTIDGGTINVAWGGGITVSASNVTLENVHVVGPQSRNFVAGQDGITTTGTAAAPITNLTITNCEVGSFGQGGIWLSHVSNVTLTDNNVHDIFYAGIMVLSGLGGTISGNTVAHIGVGWTEGGSGGGIDTNNSYGIALSYIEAPLSANITVSGNTVTDVPVWHALDTHGGQRISFIDNTVQGASRAIFITSPDTSDQPTNILVQGNQILSPAPVTFNLTPLTLYDVSGITITGNNFVGWGGESPTPSVPYYDFGDLSTGIVVGSGNVVTP